MKMCREITVIILSLVAVVVMSSPTFATTYSYYAVSSYDSGPRMGNDPIDAAPTTHPFLEQINALELRPVVNKKWDDSYYKRLYSVITDDMTNFQKLWAVYDDIVVNYTTSANCVGYAVALECALKSLGFETYHMRGQVKTANGGWTEHSWVGVNVGGKLVYFDANLPGRYGSSTATYFGSDPQVIQSYKGAFIQYLELDPSASQWLIAKESAIPDGMV